jgi:hypothetical protein
MRISVRSLVLAGLTSLSVLGGMLAWVSSAAQAKLENPFISQIPGTEKAHGITVDPATQDLYVAVGGAIDVYSSAGVYQSQITGAGVPQGSFSEACSVAVSDTTGDVYVADCGRVVVYVFNAKGEYLATMEGSDTPAGSFVENGRFYPTDLHVAVDQSSGDVYVADNEHGVVDRFNPEDEYLSQLAVPAAGQPTIDSNGDVYVNEEPSGYEPQPGVTHTDSIFEFNSSGVRIADFITPYLYVPEPNFASLTAINVRVSGVAVDPAGDLYVNNYERVGRFANLELSSSQQLLSNSPTVDEISPTGALIAQISGTPSGLFGSLLGGLALNQAGDLYVVVEANGVDIFGPRVDVPTPPSIDVESVGGVTASEATVTAQVNPNEDETSAFVEYGPTSSYGSSTVEAEQRLGEGLFDASASTVIAGLAPGTTYHYRVVAVNASHETTYGADKVFTTYPVASGRFTLPDDRAYELVSPQEKDGGRGGVYPLDFNGSALFGSANDELTESSASGEAVAYVGEPFYESHNGEHANEYVSVRTVSGWSTENITPENRKNNQERSPGYVVGFSPELSAAVVQDDMSLGAGGPPEENYEYEDLWLHTGDGPYQPLVDTQSFAFSTRIGEPVFASVPTFAGASTNFSHIIFEAHDTLDKEALPVKGEPQEATNGNLYEWVEGRLSSVNVLPGGGTDPAGFGSGVSVAIGANGRAAEYHLNHVPDLSNVISSDGTKVFWTDTKTGDLYVREDAGAPDARTVLVSAGGQFWTASSDGSLVLFTKEGHLYQFNTDTEATSDLTPGGSVEGVVGASEDGSYVYFVASGVLADGAVAGQPNLYLSHEGETRFIATLSPSDDALVPVTSSSAKTGDWSPAIATRSARVSPNGRYVAFLSVKSLTGYENRGTIELFRYGAEASQLVCVSCVPSGAPPTAGGAVPNTHYSMFGTPAINGIYQQRYLLDDGSVFFDSDEALVPQDTDGTTDVYEYENGHVSLISPGVGLASNFADASENGSNVFFTTANQLVPEDQDQNVDIYDARVDGGFPQPPVTKCTGTGCQGVPPVPPIFATPASVTFEGVGNFPAPSTPAAKTKTKVKQKPKKKSKKKSKHKGKATAKRKGKAKKASAKGRGGR